MLMAVKSLVDWIARTQSIKPFGFNNSDTIVYQNVANPQMS